MGSPTKGLDEAIPVVSLALTPHPLLGSSRSNDLIKLSVPVVPNVPDGGLGSKFKSSRTDSEGNLHG